MSRVEARARRGAPARAGPEASSPGSGLPVRRAAPILDVTVPSFRRDLAMEDDLVEEIIRVWGYDRIPSTLPGGAIVARHAAGHLAAERRRFGERWRAPGSWRW